MKGPRITVSIGDVSVYNIPKRAAMAVSRTLNEHFTANPHSKELHFEAGSLETKAVRILLISWLRDTSKIFEAHQVHFRKQFHSNIAILRAARLLGMECYTNSILQYYISYMKTEVPHYHEIACVEAMHTSYKDPVWTAMVNHLAKHPRLAGAMYYTDRFLEVKDAEARRGYALVEHLLCGYETGEKVWATGKEAAMWWASQV
ncbi:hypothetical protein SLS60_007120 [Paraconiothyrium brasiliense]|uniref:Uncharacterized protein n=1 Tax=Paraconiothyrium brasiliense TaxID=300254 RepID=A0ABR3R9U2_9PLEO